MSEGNSNNPGIDGLLQEGLDFYEQNREVEAIRCWRHVLARVPDEPRARRYLEELGVPAIPSQRRGTSGVPSSQRPKTPVPA
jgi:hypothetical protein